MKFTMHNTRDIKRHTWDVSRFPANDLTESSAKGRRAKSVDDRIAGGVHVAKQVSLCKAS